MAGERGAKKQGTPTSPASNGIRRARGFRPVRCAKTNDITIIEAGMISANDP